MALATAFPVVLPVILAQLVNGSLLSTVLRLRAARRGWWRSGKTSRSESTRSHRSV
jgi:hypothetical protein